MKRVVLLLPYLVVMTSDTVKATGEDVPPSFQAPIPPKVMAERKNDLRRRASQIVSNLPPAGQELLTKKIEEMTNACQGTVGTGECQKLLAETEDMVKQYEISREKRSGATQKSPRPTQTVRMKTPTTPVTGTGKQASVRPLERKK